MKNSQKGFVGPIVIALVLLAMLGAGYMYVKSHAVATLTETNVAPTPTVVSSASNPQLLRYDNFGVSFQYPAEWGIPKESLYNYNGTEYATIAFSPNSGFMISMGPDTGPGGQLMNETFDQMIARYRVNDKYIYDQKDVTIDGVRGVELFYQNAVTGQPYSESVDVPFGTNSYISFSSSEPMVSRDTFDAVIQSIKWDSSTGFRQNSNTGRGMYKNHGITFEYPLKFNTNYATLTIKTAVEKIEPSKLDGNGCHPAINGSRPSTTSVLMINGTKFCYTVSAEPAAGQLFTDYSYTTFKSGSAYMIDYIVHTSNGCGAYYGEPTYADCQAAWNNKDTLVVKPIEDSIGTFRFESNQ